MGQCSLMRFSWERKFRGNFPGDIFPGGNFIEPSKSFNKSANLSTKSKHIQRCKYKIFKLVEIIQRSTNHSTQLKYLLHRHYKSYNVVQTIQRFQNREIIVRDLQISKCSGKQIQWIPLRVVASESSRRYSLVIFLKMSFRHLKQILYR